MHLSMLIALAKAYADTSCLFTTYIESDMQVHCASVAHFGGASVCSHGKRTCAPQTIHSSNHLCSHAWTLLTTVVCAFLVVTSNSDLKQHEQH